MPKDIVVGVPHGTCCRCERFGLFAAVLVVVLSAGYGLVRLAEVGATEADRARATQLEASP